MNSHALPLRLDDWEEAARHVLPKPTFDYYAGGAEDELTLASNRTAASAAVRTSSKPSRSAPMPC